MNRSISQGRGRRVDAIIDADDLDGILALAEDMAEIRVAEKARAEMQATGEVPIPRELVKVVLGLVLHTRLFSRHRQLASFANFIQKFVDESKRFPSDWLTIPRPPPSMRLVGGAGERRVQTGDYRVIYEIYGGRLLVLRIGPRQEVYER
ncbi:MAG: type II toxin-antitoxin system RelE family toxin [Ferrimicrobium sp.]